MIHHLNNIKLWYKMSLDKNNNFAKSRSPRYSKEFRTVSFDVMRSILMIVLRIFLCLFWTFWTFEWRFFLVSLNKFLKLNEWKMAKSDEYFRINKSINHFHWCSNIKWVQCIDKQFKIINRDYDYEIFLF